MKTEVERGTCWKAHVELVRPKQWAKNVFVALPLLFSGRILIPSAMGLTAIAVICFCALSSAVYCLNDVVDADADLRHPRKCRRPVPSGRVSVRAALVWAAVLAAGGLGVGAVLLPSRFVLFGVLYMANSLIYCLYLKYRVIVDVMSIAIGFLFRLIAGCVAIAVAPSSWILLCGFSLALLLGFGKRRLEFTQLESLTEYRVTLQSYSCEKLDVLLAVTCGLCLVSYALYTTAPETVQTHHTENLIYTIPPVFYGVFRYIFKIQEGRHDGPVEVLLRDRVFWIDGLLWVVMCAVILYV